MNRLWSELVGRGFYEPVDDIGPDRRRWLRRPRLPGRAFAGEHYDVKWLMRTITATEAYHARAASRIEPNKAPFAASCSQRLRAISCSTRLRGAGIRRNTAAPTPREAARRGLPVRGQMIRRLATTPACRRDEVAGSIPQALFLMNGPARQPRRTGRQPYDVLGRLLGRNEDDKGVV